MALGMLADLGVRQQKYGEALTPARELAALDRSFASLYRLGTVLEHTGQLEEAAAAYRAAAGAAPDVDSRVRAHRAAGETAKKRRNWSAAHEAQLAAHTLRPEDPEIVAELGRLAYARNLYPEALRWTRQALASRPSRQDQQLAATLLYRSKEYAGAIEEWNALLRGARDPDERRRLHLDLANAYTAQRDDAAATRSLRQADAIRRDAATTAALAQSLEREGRRDEAIAHYRQVLARQPSALTHMQLATLLAQAGNSDEALEHLDAAARKYESPEARAAILKQKGFLYHRTRRYPRRAGLSSRRSRSRAPTPSCMRRSAKPFSRMARTPMPSLT